MNLLYILTQLFDCRLFPIIGIAEESRRKVVGVRAFFYIFAANKTLWL